MDQVSAATLFRTSPGLVGPTDIRLRPYQRDAIDAIRQKFSDGDRSTLLILPTGTGKTITFGSIIKRTIEKGGRSLVLAHRGELIDQAMESLCNLGLDPAVEKAGEFARAIYEPDVVVATVQTLQRDRLESWPADHFRLIVTDEAHHATADSYRKIYKHFCGKGGARHLGVTATADRADEDLLSDVFDSVAYELSLWDAMTAEPPGPYLARLRFVQCDVGIDLRDIRTTADDFNQADLEEAIKPHIETLANAIRQEAGQRKTLVFTPDVGSAQAMATALDSIGVPAQWVAGDDSMRKEKVKAFKRGEFQALCNCALLTEGFDCPDVAAIALCRPTKSRPLYAQMVGRGTRMASGKTDCLLIDFNWLTAKHDLVKPVELFDTTKTSTELIEVAQEMAVAQPGRDLLDLIDQAQEVVEQRRIIRVKAQQREVKYRKVSYDPISVMDVLGIPIRKETVVVTPATEKQQAYLTKCKLTNVGNISKRQATTIIGHLMKRRDNKLATVNQVQWLIRNGHDPVDARSLTFADASAALDRYFGKRS